MNNKNNSDINNETAAELAVATYYDRHNPTSFMLIFYGVIGFPGNMIVAMVYLKAKKMTGTDFLIFVMAIWDVGVALTGILKSMVDLVHLYNTTLCRIATVLTYLTNIPPCYLIFGVTVVRFVHVCKPHLVYYIQTKVKSYCMCVLMFTLLISLAFITSYGRESCGVDDKFYRSLIYKIIVATIGFLYVFCLIGLIVLNYKILKRMLQQRKIMESYKNIPSGRIKSTVHYDEKYPYKYKYHRSVHQHENLTDVKGFMPQRNKIDKESHISSNFRDDISKTTYVSTKNKKGSSESEHNVKKGLKIKSHLKARNSLETESMKTEVTEVESFKSGTISSDKIIEKNDGSEKKSEMIFNDENVTIENNTDGKMKEKEPEIVSKSQRSCCPRSVSLCSFEGLNRVTLKLSIVSIMYIIIYVPFFVVRIMRLLDPKGEADPSKHNLYKYLYIPVEFLVFAGSAVNPVIYTFVDPKFRSQCKNLLFCR